MPQDPWRRRRQPTQRRSRETVERILDSAVDLLDTVGFDGLNTNAIAANAGISVHSVYSYFPDKYAIVHELFRRSEERRVAALDPYIEAFAASEDWQAVLAGALAEMARQRVQEKGARALREAMSAAPQLRNLDQESTLSVAVRFAGALRARDPGMDEDLALRRALTLVTAATATLDGCVVAGSVAEDLLAEAITLSQRYVAGFLQGSPG